MAISYPLSHPSLPGFRELKFILVNINGMARSEFTGQEQITQWPGEWLEVEASLPAMETRLKAEAWTSMLTALRGRIGTFLLGPEKPARTPQGTASGVTVSGGAQLGTTITLAGSGAFVVGDWIQLGSGATSRLHKILAAGAVAGTHNIFPRLRESPGNGSSVVVTNPKGLFRLAEDAREWDIDVAKMYGIRFRAMEAIRL